MLLATSLKGCNAWMSASDSVAGARPGTKISTLCGRPTASKAASVPATPLSQATRFRLVGAANWIVSSWPTPGTTGFGGGGGVLGFVAFAPGWAGLWPSADATPRLGDVAAAPASDEAVAEPARDE